MLIIIIAGELIFSLPFHIPRFFRPTFLDVFEISNSQLGDMFAVYGVIAMLSYFPGGVLADKFHPRILMTISLVMTALGGLYMFTLPKAEHFYYLFGYWGFTSVFLFWAAMIKETRSLGKNTQGFAFGLLDGGRGLVASLAASLAVLLITYYLGSNLTSDTDKVSALRLVIFFYSVLTLIAAVLCWTFLPRKDPVTTIHTKISFESVYEVLKNKTVWLQGGVVICAYCGFKALDNYGIYATQVLGFSQLESSQLTAYASYSRPVAALLAGILADKWLASRTTTLAFFIALFGFSGLYFLNPNHAALWAIISNLLVTFIAVYALRAIYFALVQESNLPLGQTGTAVGLISLVGYTPDIFFASITGRILDANPGYVGFQHYFIVLSTISIVGIVLMLLLQKSIKQS